MIYIKTGGKEYPATINGKLVDRDWDDRESKDIILKMDYNTAINLFVDGIAWSIIDRNEVPAYKLDENGNYVLDENNFPIQEGTEVTETEYDNSDFCVAGDLTDHRDGTVTVKMGKLTELEEAYKIMLGGI